ncbi:MAG TPA: hypothetical protein VMU89_14045 [Thermomicrobiaceae bacterium]|nr:hypothetical protein [Thermomicrobiaceae bacterium]
MAKKNAKRRRQALTRRLDRIESWWNDPLVLINRAQALLLRRVPARTRLDRAS